MSIRYGQKVTPLVSRKSSFFKKNRFDGSFIKKPLRVTTPNNNTWTRPSDWLTMPTITSTEQKIALLMPVFPQGSNFLAFLVSGAYTVDWGDGVVENVAAGVKAQHAYDYADPDLNATVTSDGYKMAVVVITPQAGQNLTSVNFNQIYAIAGSTFPNSSPILEIILSCPNLASNGLSLGAATVTSVCCKSLIHFSGINMGGLTSVGSLFQNVAALKQVSNFYTTATITNTSQMFYGCRSLVSVPLFNTASVTSMANMFGFCSSLTTVPAYNTASVTNMSNMFIGCASLVSVPLFDTSKVTTFDNTFNGCTSLTTVPLFDTSKVTSMFQMFQSCRTLTSVPLFNTLNVTNTELMFNGCSSLVSVPLFNTSNATNMGNMFQSCLALRDVPLFDTSKATNMQQFVRTCPLLTTVPPFNTSSATNMQSMFAGCPALITVPLFNTSNVTNMTSMFDGCNSLTSVPLFDTSKVLTMNSMFNACNSLTSVPLFDTSKVTTMNNMFLNCVSLVTIPQFNTVAVITMTSMFQGCVSLVTVPQFNTANVTLMANMFNSCNSLVSVPLFDTSKVTSMSNMFNSCASLVSIPSFNTPLLIDIGGAFQSCTKLISIPLFDTSKVTTMNSMFNGCNALVTVPPFVSSSVIAANFTNTFNGCISLTRGALSGTKFTISYSGCKLSQAELESVFNSLDTIGAASQTITVTNNWGARTPVTLTGTTTVGSTTISMANTTGIVVGMQVTGTGSPLTTARAVTFTDAGDLVNLASHGLSDGDEVSFATIVTTTGIIINRIYYVVNAAAGTFQVAATLGGPALALTTNGSGTLRYRTEVVSINPNVSITVSRQMTAAGANSLTLRQLRTGTALLKGWAVTG